MLKITGFGGPIGTQELDWPLMGVQFQPVLAMVPVIAMMWV